MNRTASKGIYLALLTALVSGISIFVNKFAVGSVTPPLFFTAFKNTGVALLIVGLLFAAKKYKKLKTLTKKEILSLVLIGIVGGSLPFYMYFKGLSMIPAVNAAIIHKTLVFWVALLAIPLLKENLSKLQGLAIMILFLSNLVVGGFRGLEFSVGELLALGATVLWAVENVIAKKVLKTVDPDIVTASRMGIGALILLGASAVVTPGSFAGVVGLTGVQWLWMGLTMVMLLGYVMTWYRALKFAPAVTVATVLVGSTLVTNVLSAFFITKTWSAGMTVQGVMILVGLGIFWYASKNFADKKVQLSKQTT